MVEEQTMTYRASRAWAVMLLVVAVALALGLSGRLQAQGRGGQAPSAPPPTAKAAGPIDLTGYWVSIVTQDWRQRLGTPPKGDYASIPVTAEAKKVGRSWAPEK